MSASMSTPHLVSSPLPSTRRFEQFHGNATASTVDGEVASHQSQVPLRLPNSLMSLTVMNERKSHGRVNQDGENNVEETADHVDDEQSAQTTERMHSAVESAADALLQRLRTRVRVTKPNDQSETNEREDNNQTVRDESLEHYRSWTSTPSAGLTRQRLALDSSMDPSRSPLFRPSTTLGTSASAAWRAALMTQASARGSPGEQLDLPDFIDDEWSEASIGQQDVYSDDGATSDGEIQPPQQLQTLDETGHVFVSQPHLAVDTAYESESGAGSEQLDSRSMGASLSNRDVNVSKAIALKNSMMRNLVRLAFNEDLSRAALDAGVREIEQYDSDCELAYVDIFMTLVKLVCDAHHEIVPPSSSSSNTEASIEDPSPRGHFKWPVFDMAQFEFGNARSGTCFDSVCVLINLPKVAIYRTEELMEVLSSCLFEMIGDPIQVLIPSVSSTGRTKGHAFLEFDDPEMARQCAAAIDGLTWGRGPYGRIRARLFRQYQVKSPVPPRPLPTTEGLTNQQRLPRPPQRRAITRAALETSAIDGARAQLLDSRGLSRDDLSASDMSHGSWNTSSRVSAELDDSQRLFGVADRALLQQSAASSQDESTRFQRSLDDSEMQLGELRLSSDDDDDDEDGESSATDSDLDLDRSLLLTGAASTGLPPAPSTLARSHRLQLLRQSLSPLPLDTHTPPPRWRPHTASQSGELPASGVDIEGPWKAYCEELIARNREMQEQVSYARRRIAALGHNNQKLHLLIDRMERDRDGLLFENDLLQTQLHGYEDHERQQEALMKELAALRRRMRRRDQRIERGLLDSGLNMGPGAHGGVAVELEGGVMSLDDLEEQLVHNIISSRRLDDLKEWEQMLEGSLMRVRSIKEEIAMELQKKLAQQTDESGGVQDHKLCVVCLSNEKSILCLPCRHLCLCQVCSQHAELDKCPICRLAVDNMLLVYA